MSLDYGRRLLLSGSNIPEPYRTIVNLCHEARDLPKDADLAGIWKKIVSSLPADTPRASSWSEIHEISPEPFEDYQHETLALRIFACQQRILATKPGDSLPPPIDINPALRVIENDKRVVTSFETLARDFDGPLLYAPEEKRIFYKVKEIRGLLGSNPLLLIFFKMSDLEGHPELKTVVDEFALPAPVPQERARWATREFKKLSRQDLEEKGWQLSECSELIFTDCDVDLDELIDLLPSHLRELHLINCGIKAVPETIGKLKELHTLYLNNNPLECFPLATCKLPKLERLYLEECGLSALPEGLGGFEALKSIELSRNQFTRIPKALQSIRPLDGVYLCGNIIKEFPKADDLSTDWGLVDISCNPITSFPLNLFEVLKRTEVVLSKEMDGVDLLEPYYEKKEEAEHLKGQLEQLLSSAPSS